MAELPWSKNKRLDYNTPCKLCREEKLSVSELCPECMKEELTSKILKFKY